MADLPDIPTPCTTVCQLDPATGYCRGCLRTAAEIGRWPVADNDERLAILRELKARRRAAGRTSRRPHQRRR
jgi:predicted Fe-S protein YdhL (DUF1289 family)